MAEAAENENDWFMNLFMSYISYWLGGLLRGYPLSPYDIIMWATLFGNPGFWIDTMTSLEMLPEIVTSWDNEFN